MQIAYVQYKIILKNYAKSQQINIGKEMKMSTKLFQTIAAQMKATIGRNVGVIDNSGQIIACSDLARIGRPDEAFASGVNGFNPGFEIHNGKVYRAIGSDVTPKYIVFVEGDDEFAQKMSGVVEISLSAVSEYYVEKFDRGKFIKDIIMDNILASDIYSMAKEMRFLGDVDRVVMLIRFSVKMNVSSLDVIRALFPEQQKDFVFTVNDTDLVIVKEVKPNVESEHIEMLAKALIELIDHEEHARACVGIGSVVSDITELNRSFKESQIAIEVGKIFEREKNILSYNNLGLGRLIYQLPNTLCENFLDEVFKRGSIDSLDQETLFTIHKFFENNLNVSETARKLFVHRNTLVYRLEKIRRLTGLDLREFEHAIIFKVALMVRKYLTARPIQF